MDAIKDEWAKADGLQWPAEEAKDDRRGGLISFGSPLESPRDTMTSRTVGTDMGRTVGFQDHIECTAEDRRGEQRR